MKRDSSRSPKLFVALVTLLCGAACREIEPIDAAAAPNDLSATERAAVELGQRLFFDAALSSDGTVACASCHAPLEAGADGEPVSLGVGAQTGRRNAPTVFNVGFKQHLFWDGRATTLEEQSLMPLRSEDEMAASDDDVIAYLSADARYVDAFAAAFPGRDIAMDTVASALATYERQLVTPSRVDAFLGGSADALDEREQRGLDFFRGNCAFCHDGPGVGGQRFEKLGEEVPWPEDRSDDQGLYEITGDEGDKLVFVVPQLRNVARTAPYFHDGSVETLEEAVELMGRHQIGSELSSEEIADVVAFLEALSADPEESLLVPLD